MAKEPKPPKTDELILTELQAQTAILTEHLDLMLFKMDQLIATLRDIERRTPH